MRLDKFLVSTGRISRADAGRAARGGSVTVNGTVEKRADRHIDPERDVVTLYGESIVYRRFVYILLNKDSLKEGVLRLMRALFHEKRLNKVLRFLSRCDTILVRYIVYSLIDSLIIGLANALFMLVMGMQYTGLISMIIAVTNLVPTFGPIIGGAIGALILLLVNPLHALIFIIFSFVLQFLDAYIIKPKLFGNSLGVSGLLILISVIVFGGMFGVVGMLLAIPVAAILDFVYNEALMPWLEKRAAARESGA